MRPLTIVVGTRPECIKVAPLVHALKQRGIPVKVLHSGQHADLWKGSGLEPDGIWDGSPIVGQFVLVQGDTRTAFDAHRQSICGWRIHLEAGVRSGDLANPYPEEGYRREIDIDSRYRFCATDDNFANLVAEGLGDNSWVTGNTGVDACLERQRPVAVHDRHATVLVTLHRRESAGEPMQRIVAGLLTVAIDHPDIRFQVPLHPNNLARDAFARVIPPENLRCGPALAYGTFLNKLAHCQAVLTDSGGVQEDAATLGIPCAVAREVTDRPESVASGHALVVGRSDRSVEEGLRRVLDGLLRTDPSDVFGDGKAAGRIADHLGRILEEHPEPHPDRHQTEPTRQDQERPPDQVAHRVLRRIP